MKVNNIKLAAMDLDGTLLNDNKLLCEGALETIKEAKLRGIHIIPITGRPLAGVPDFLTKLDEIEYVITSNGAQIIDSKTIKPLYSCTVSNEISKEIIKTLRNIDCLFEPFTDGVGYSEKYVYDYYMNRFTGTVLEEYFTSSRVICRSYEEIFENPSKCADEFFVTCGDEKTRIQIMSEVSKLGDHQFCTHADRFLEISKRGADKGNALRTLCNHIGIDIAQTIAFGDGENDIPLLEAAGTGVAMENANPKLKAKADIIAKSNNDNGVCEVIRAIMNQE